MKKNKPKKKNNPSLSPEIDRLIQLLGYSRVGQPLKLSTLEYAAYASQAEIKEIIKILEKELDQRKKISQQYEKKWQAFVKKQKQSFKKNLDKLVTAKESAQIGELKKKLAG